MSLGLEERSHVTSLISRYARSIDAADVPAVMQCLSDDVSLSYDGGRLQMEGRAEAERFFRDALRGPSTHLLSNYDFERQGTDVVANCSAIACVCRDPGTLTVRGLVYSFTCTLESREGHIRRLEHRATWEFVVPGGPCSPS
jgi:hypothetical protein